MNFSFGNRVARPWPMIDAMASTRLSFSDDSARNVGDDWRAFDFADDDHLLVAEAFPLVG